MIIVFVLGYAAIALEHPIKVDKAASALIIGGLGWALFAFSGVDHHTLTHEIQHHIVDIAEILFFLLGAMTIVELVDAHQGFSIITDKITTNKKVYLIWILSVITFFFSAVLDNLTTAIVMAALLPKLIKDKETLWLFAGVLIMAANAGGAWSPIGDVTTIMLWIGGQVSAANIITAVIIPSTVCAIVPLIYLSFKLNITSSKLTKTTHYTSYQQKLYRLVKFLKEERGIGYRRISHILYEKNYRSIRTNSILKNNYIYSIYKKGKIREERINREFDSKIENIKYIFKYSD